MLPVIHCTRSPFCRCWGSILFGKITLSMAGLLSRGLSCSRRHTSFSSIQASKTLVYPAHCTWTLSFSTTMTDTFNHCPSTGSDAWILSPWRNGSCKCDAKNHVQWINYQIISYKSIKLSTQHKNSEIVNDTHLHVIEVLEYSSIINFSWSDSQWSNYWSDL